MNRDQQITAIAEAFHEVLKQWLTKDEMEIVRQRNVGSGDDICATHDFCDANMAMAPAFEQVMGHEIDSASEDDAAIWNEAWSLAKKLYLVA